MSTLYLETNGDLKVSQQGGLLLADGWDEIRQRIFRRILTNPRIQEENGTFTPAGYIYHPEYGLGLGFVIAKTMDDEAKTDLKQRIIEGIMEDASVDKSLIPTILITEPGFKRMDVNASFRLVTGVSQMLAFEISQVA